MILTTGTFSVSASGTTKGWQKDNYGWWYKTGKNTYAKNEFLNINGNFYLFDSNGYMCTGWNYINNGWCFANTDGVIVRDGWVYSNNKWYYIDLGKMCTGWLIVKNDKYYLDNSGAMRTGWAYINNNWYYFNSNGTMATNITIDGWKIDSSGIAKEIKADDKIITPNIKDEKFTNNEIYNKKINEYNKALKMGIEPFELLYDSGFDYNSINALMIRNAYYYGGSISYSLYDINKDSSPELFFTNGETIIDVYTIHNNKLIKLFKDCSFGERSRLHILSNRGKIKFLTEGSSSAFSSEFEILLLDPKTDSLVSDIAYYYDENGPWEYNSNPYVYTDKKSFNSLLNDFMECSIFDRLEWNIIDEKTVLY